MHYKTQTSHFLRPTLSICHTEVADSQKPSVEATLTWFNALLQPIHLGCEQLKLVVQVHHRRLHGVSLQPDQLKLTCSEVSTRISLVVLFKICWQNSEYLVPFKNSSTRAVTRIGCMSGQGQHLERTRTLNKHWQTWRLAHANASRTLLI